MNTFQNWTLFLDRDGVINQRLIGDYVKCPEDFHFIENVPEAIHTFSKVFNKIIVVTNQQGIGKRLMTTTDLENIHDKMISNTQKAGGRIDAIYFAPQLAGKRNFLRKPNIGMGLAAKKQFPEIDFKRSVMAGDSLGDMQFGKRLGMKTVFIGPNKDLTTIHAKIIDYYFPSLFHFAQFLNREE